MLFKVYCFFPHVFKQHNQHGVGLSILMYQLGKNIYIQFQNMYQLGKVCRFRLKNF